MTDLFEKPAAVELRAGQKWRHKRRGGVYTIVNDNAGLECSSAPDLEEAFSDQAMVVYQHELGGFYVRPIAEFLDGRFELISEEQ
jgi:hypothetical protein